MLRLFLFVVLSVGVTTAVDAQSIKKILRQDWPNTDIATAIIPLKELKSGGVGRDDIAPIDDPKFVPIARVAGFKDAEPLITLMIDGEARAYPLRMMIWHEIVNDRIGNTPAVITFCPLCNAAIVFDRRLDGVTYDFGTSGLLRHSDLVMYDRQTESLWQQFTGTALMGALAGKELAIIPSRLESVGAFKKRAPSGLVMLPPMPITRAYGRNPYVGYDSSRRPMLYRGKIPKGIAPLARVVRVDKEAWALDLLKNRGKIVTPEGIVLTWSPGQASALDTTIITDGFDVGNVVVQRQTVRGLEDIPYGVDFAFAFHAFYPDAVLHLAD